MKYQIKRVSSISSASAFRSSAPAPGTIGERADLLKIDAFYVAAMRHVKRGLKCG